MKLLIITAISEFAADIKLLLKESGVTGFSYCDVTGNSCPATGSPFDNWFGTDVNTAESVMFYAFTENITTEKAFEAVGKYNSMLEGKSLIHIASINIDKIL